MKLKLAILALILLCSTVVHASTNSFIYKVTGNWKTNTYYNAGENTFEITPTVSSTAFFDRKGAHTFGFSLEAEHWQTLTTGTGIELGCYDVQNSPNGLDHIALMEDYRLVYAPNTFLLNRFAIVMKSGVEQYFTDGTKDIEFGIGINYNAPIKNMRFEVDYMQHIRTDSSKNGGTARAGIQWIF